MIVSEMRERMTNLEYIHWQIYYARRNQEAELESMKGKA